jgi:nucleoside-diphosphate kinase
MIKPDAVADGHTGPIIQQIEKAGYKIVAITKLKMSPEQAGQFYAIHSERPFFQSLCDYMSKSEIIPMILEKENAVADFRTFIGSTNPAEAAIRKQFAKSLEANAIHGSDSDENAAIEGAFFFPGV